MGGRGKREGKMKANRLIKSASKTPFLTFRSLKATHKLFLPFFFLSVEELSSEITLTGGYQERLLVSSERELVGQ
jgi:hypothetical protein